MPIIGAGGWGGDLSIFVKKNANMIDTNFFFEDGHSPSGHIMRKKILKLSYLDNMF